MARKIKVDNAILKRLSRKEEKEERIEFKKKRRFILIVCEGTKTEPNYFEAKKQELPANVLETVEIDIQGTGKGTLKVVEAAEEEVERAKKSEIRFSIPSGLSSTEIAFLRKISTMRFSSARGKGFTAHGQMKPSSCGIFCISSTATPQ